MSFLSGIGNFYKGYLSKIALPIAGTVLGGPAGGAAGIGLGKIVGNIGSSPGSSSLSSLTGDDTAPDVYTSSGSSTLSLPSSTTSTAPIGQGILDFISNIKLPTINVAHDLGDKTVSETKSILPWLIGGVLLFMLTSSSRGGRRY